MYSKITSFLHAMKFLMLSTITRPFLISKPGTIITGSVRSGTTLALKVHCPDLSKREEMAGSALNEPQPLSTLIVLGKPRTALFVLPLTIHNRHRLIKSPHLAFLLPHIEPKFNVIVIFRDLRLIVASIFHHKNSQNIHKPSTPYWARYMTDNIPNDPVLKVLKAIETFYTNIIKYEGNFMVWNYGFWDQWQVRNVEIGHLYNREEETSSSIVQDIKEGTVFSNRQFSINVWNNFCREFGVTKQQEYATIDMNKKIQELFKNKGHELKTLDDA